MKTRKPLLTPAERKRKLKEYTVYALIMLAWGAFMFFLMLKTPRQVHPINIHNTISK